MSDAKAERPGAGRRLLFTLAVAAAFLLASFVMLMGSALWDDPSDEDAWTVFALAASLLTAALLFVAAGLVTWPGWAKWVAPALLIGPPILFFSGILTWLINTI